VIPRAVDVDTGVPKQAQLASRNDRSGDIATSGIATTDVDSNTIDGTGDTPAQGGFLCTPTCGGVLQTNEDT
jgi:hypothetical protein